MTTLPFFFALVVAVRPDTTPMPDSVSRISQRRPDIPVSIESDTIRRRARAVEYSDAYAIRLTIHRIGSYTMLPLFGAEYALGQNLLNDSRPPSWIRSTHAGTALGLGALFRVNTVTGVWNLWDARHDPAGRTRRIIHVSLMLASDAGFATTGVLGGSAHSVNDNRLHRNFAIGSMALAAAGTAMMWLWKD